MCYHFMLSFLDVIICVIVLCYHFVLLFLDVLIMCYHLMLAFLLQFYVIIFGCYHLCYHFTLSFFNVIICVLCCFVLSFLDVIIIVIICVIILCYNFFLFPPFFIFVENMTHSPQGGVQHLFYGTGLYGHSCPLKRRTLCS